MTPLPAKNPGRIGRIGDLGIRPPRERPMPLVKIPAIKASTVSPISESRMKRDAAITSASVRAARNRAVHAITTLALPRAQNDLGTGGAGLQRSRSATGCEGA